MKGIDQFGAPGGELGDVLEENRPGNVKKAFAQIYSGWDTFLAHIWYVWTGRQPLVQVSYLSTVSSA